MTKKLLNHVYSITYPGLAYFRRGWMILLDEADKRFPGFLRKSQPYGVVEKWLKNSDRAEVEEEIDKGV